MGSQELHLKAADFEEMVKMAGVVNYEKGNFPDFDNWPKQPRCPSKSLYSMLGINEYCSLDLNEELGSISHDYNLPFEDTSMYSQFDIVTDHGACEHAFNIAESYRTMHRLCSTGGLIIIAQQLWRGNGYYLFDKPFFEGIAAANNYKIVFSSYIVGTCTKTKSGSDYEFHIPMNRDLLLTLDLNRVSGIGVYAVLQKKTEADFQFPYQGHYLSEKQGHIGFNRFFYKDPPGYSYIPVADYSEFSGKVLAKELFKRFKNKINIFRNIF